MSTTTNLPGRQDEIQLSASERQFGVILRDSQIGYGLSTVSGQILDANPSLCKIIGYPIDEFRTLRYTDLVHPDDRPAQAVLLDQLLAGEIPSFVIENRYVCKGGESIWVRKSVTSYCDSSSGWCRIVALVEDISERKRVERDLVESNERMEYAFRAADEGVWDWNVRTNEVFYSTQWKSMLGYEDAEIQPKFDEWEELVHPDDRVHVLKSINAFLEKRQKYEITFRMRHKDGHYRDILARAYPISNEDDTQISRVVGTHLDITERNKMIAELNRYRVDLEHRVEQRTQALHSEVEQHKKVASALRITQQHLEEAQRIAGVGSWQWFHGSDLVMDCRELNRILGLPDEATSSFTEIKKLLLEDSLVQLLTVMEQCMHTGVPSDITLKCLREDGVCIWLQVRGERMVDAHGAIIGLRGTALDITKLKQIESDLLHSNERLQESLDERLRIEGQMLHQARLAAVGQLAAGIAHDFNNVLGTIILYAERMVSAVSLDSGEQHRVSVILEQAKRGSDLVQQILDFSRSSMLRSVSLDLALLLQAQVDLLRRTLPEHIEVQLHHEPHPYIINADKTRMQQIIANLAINARDAMPRGGILSIKLSHFVVGVDQIPPVLEMEPGTWIKLSFADTGTGISPENIDHLFEPFFTTKEPGLGTGLGLAQVYGIIQQHGGHISVESQWGEGATFSLYFPSSELPPKITSSQQSVELNRGHEETILLVEDNIFLREALADIMHSINYRTIEVPTGRAALKLLEDQEGQIDLVISDFVMPEMGGRDLVLALRARNLSIPVILISGHQKDNNIADLVESGTVVWLTKPFRSKEIADLVAATMHKHYNINTTT